MADKFKVTFQPTTRKAITVRENGVSDLTIVNGQRTANTSTTSAVLSGTTAIFTRQNGTTFTLDLTSINNAITNTSITSGVLSGNNAIFTRADNSTFTVDLSGISSVDNLSAYQANTNPRLDALESPSKNITANSINVSSTLTVDGDILLRGDNINIGDGGDIVNINAAVNNHIIPASNVTYDLGSTTNAWRDLYLSGNTIFLGGLRIQDGSEKITIVKKDDTANIIFDSSNTSAADTTLRIDATAGAIANLTVDTTVQTAIKALNEAVFNLQRNTFVRDVTFTADVTQGGAGTTVTLTIVTTGNPNQFTVDWGDGTIDTTVDDTPSHTYATNTGSPFSIKVIARNTEGLGSNSQAASKRANYITIYTADPTPSFSFFNTLSRGSALSAPLEANTGTPIYIENTTGNIANNSATATFAIDWGDGGAIEGVASKVAEGGTDGSRIDHTYTANSGASRFTVQLYANSHSTATPGIFPLSSTALLKVFDLAIGAPDSITTKTLTWDNSSVGTSPRLAHGFVENTSGKIAGQSISSTFPRYTSGTVTSTTMSSFFHTTGSVTQQINDTASGTAVTDASGIDFYNLNASGESVSAITRIHAPGLYQTAAKAKVSVAIGDQTIGVNKVELVTSEGNSNELFFVKDNLTSVPTNDVSSVSVSGTGTPNYISGIPYYNSGDSLTVSGIVVTNLTGQTYYNGDFLTIGDTNVETGSGTSIPNQTYTYSSALSSSDRSSAVPNANLASVNIEDLTANIGTGDNAVRLTVLSRNVNGTDQDTITSPIINVFNGVDVIDEGAISVADSLGSGHTTDGKRITGFTGATPSFSGSTDYYVNNAWSGAVTVAGTDEAIIRYGQLIHHTVDYSSGYLPTGPDLTTGRAGTQYFRFAFKRAGVSNFRVRLTGRVSGFFFAAPGTDLDTTSGSNGWLNASIQYAGSGIPGANSGAGGNGSDGCAFTGGDRIIDGTDYTNQTFDLTLGTVSTSDAHNNQVLISIALNSDDNLTALSIEAT